MIKADKNFDEFLRLPDARGIDYSEIEENIMEFNQLEAKPSERMPLQFVIPDLASQEKQKERFSNLKSQMKLYQITQERLNGSLKRLRNDFN